MQTQQKVISCKCLEDVEVKANEHIKEGWYVKSITAEHVSNNGNHNLSIRGGFVLLFEKY